MNITLQQADAAIREILRESERRGQRIDELTRLVEHLTRRVDELTAALYRERLLGSTDELEEAHAVIAYLMQDVGRLTQLKDDFLTFCETADKLASNTHAAYIASLPSPEHNPAAHCRTLAAALRLIGGECKNILTASREAGILELGEVDSTHDTDNPA